MLKAPDHQVAGHHARSGALGPLVDGSGRFYKPLQTDDRGQQELAFYTSFSSNPRVPSHIRRFFPLFFGTQLLDASDGSGLHPHLVLQDLISHLPRPSIIDLKIGSRTWYPSSGEDYIRKCLSKDRETTSLQLGFRVSGLQVGYGDSGFWKPDKNVVKGFKVADVRVILRKFVSSNPSSGPDSEPDCAFASTVYGGSQGILAQLLELKAWFEDQTIFHFYSSSVLMVFEKGEVEATRGGAQVKLVDFAHVVEGNGVIDHNFLGGLCSLIKLVSDILTGPAEFDFANGLNGSERHPTA
ncbi:inositol polyphosphate multikinase beta-like [Aristolochia californica]|uniref:inositol polyphosphate multikinase beta-like n=1 Tax=Aristolochia californica TaxID=171875 RepID=UPI0035DF43DB